MNTVILLIVVMLLLVLAAVLSVAFVVLLVMGSAWLAGGEKADPKTCDHDFSHKVEGLCPGDAYEIAPFDYLCVKCGKSLNSINVEL